MADGVGHGSGAGGRRTTVCVSLVVAGLLVACGARPSALEPRRYRSGDPYAQAAGDCLSGFAEDFLRLTNTLRYRQGLRAVQCLSALERMAADHAARLARDPAAPPHGAVAGAGDDGLEARAERNGLDLSGHFLVEGVGGGEIPETALNAHLGTVFHRGPILSPGTQYFGAATTGGQTVLLWLQSVEPPAVTPVWPADLAAGVPTGFSPAGERPLVPGQAMAGYPVSLHLPRWIRRDGTEPGAPRVRRFEVSVEECGRSRAVAGELMTAAGGLWPLSSADVVFLPRARLSPAAVHHVSVAWDDADGSHDRQWSFTTGVESRRAVR